MRKTILSSLLFLTLFIVPASAQAAGASVFCYSHTSSCSNLIAKWGIGSGLTVPPGSRGKVTTVCIVSRCEKTRFTSFVAADGPGTGWGVMHEFKRSGPYRCGSVVSTAVTYNGRSLRANVRIYCNRN